MRYVPGKLVGAVLPAIALLVLCPVAHGEDRNIWVEDKSLVFESLDSQHSQINALRGQIHAMKTIQRAILTYIAFRDGGEIGKALVDQATLNFSKEVQQRRDWFKAPNFTPEMRKLKNREFDMYQLNGDVYFRELLTALSTVK